MCENKIRDICHWTIPAGFRVRVVETKVHAGNCYPAARFVLTHMVSDSGVR